MEGFVSLWKSQWKTALVDVTLSTANGSTVPDIPAAAEAETQCSVPTAEPSTSNSSKPALEAAEASDAPLALIVHDHTFVDALSLGEYLGAAAETDRGVIVIDGQGHETVLSYQTVWHRACSTARALIAARSESQQQGQQPRAVLHFSRLDQHIVAFWGCILSRTIPVTVAVPPVHTPEHATVKKLINVWQLLQKPCVLTDDHSGALEEIGLSSIKLLDLEAAGDAISGDDTSLPAWPSADEVAFFQLTSGSTGVPKCVQISHRGVAAHAFGSAEVLGITELDISMNWLPLDHVVPLLTCHCADVIRACTQVMVIPDLILGDPLCWLRLCDKHHVTRTWSPNFGFVLAAAALEATEEVIDVAHVKSWINAGEQVTKPTIKRFVKAAARCGVQLSSHVPSFGMAEACTCFTWRPPTSELQLLAEDGQLELINLGPPMNNIDIRICDQQNQVVREGVVGRFQLRGVTVTRGYLDNAAANAAAFVGDGWFNTGDCGVIVDGEFSVAGRESETCVVRGVNWYCHELEGCARGAEGVDQTCCAAISAANVEEGTEELAIVFVADVDTIRTARNVREVMATRMGLSVKSIAVPREEFLKTTSGKVQRNAMRKNFESGIYDDYLHVEEMSGVMKRAWGPLEHIELEEEKEIAVLGGDKGQAEALARCLQGTWCSSSDDFEEFNWKRYERVVLCFQNDLSSLLRLVLLTAQAIHKPTSMVAVLPPECTEGDHQGDDGVRLRWQESFFAVIVKSLGKEYGIPTLIVHAHKSTAFTAAAVAAAIPSSATASTSGEVQAVDGGWRPLRLEPATLTNRSRPQTMIVAGVGGVAFMMLQHWVQVWQPEKLVLLGRKKPNQMSGKVRKLREISRRRTEISYVQVVSNAGTRKWGDAKNRVESAYEAETLEAALEKSWPQWRSVDQAFFFGGQLELKPSATVSAEGLLDCHVPSDALNPTPTVIKSAQAFVSVLSKASNVRLLVASSLAGVSGASKAIKYAATAAALESIAASAPCEASALVLSAIEQTGIAKSYPAFAAVAPALGMELMNQQSAIRRICSVARFSDASSALIGFDSSHRNTRALMGLPPAAVSEVSPFAQTLAPIVSRAADQELDINATFFDQGMNSLSSIRVARQLSLSLGIDVPVKALFDYPSIAELAEFLQPSSGGASPAVASRAIAEKAREQLAAGDVEAARRSVDEAMALAEDVSLLILAGDLALDQATAKRHYQVAVDRASGVARVVVEHKLRQLDGQSDPALGSFLTNMPSRWHGKELSWVGSIVDVRCSNTAALASFTSFSKSIRELHVGGCNLSELPDEMESMPLVLIEAGGNRFETIPPVLARIPSLRVLDLRCQRSALVVKDDVDFSHLEDLSLSVCTVLGSIKLGSELVRLRFAETSSNVPDLSLCEKLTDLDICAASPEDTEWISSNQKLQNVTTLFLRSVGLSSIRGISGWSAVKQLFLQGNQLTEIPSEISLMPHLRQLEVQQNALTCLPASLKQISSLKILFAQANKLTRDCLPIVSAIPRLQYLGLGANQIQFCDSDIETLTRGGEVQLGIGWNLNEQLSPENLVLDAFMSSTDIVFDHNNNSTIRGGGAASLAVVVMSPQGPPVANAVALRENIRAAGLDVDFIYVCDPANCFYLQDPAGAWNGIAYYEELISQAVTGYSNVLMFGSSMGASATLLFASLATRAIAFSPETNLSLSHGQHFNEAAQDAFASRVQASCRDADVCVHVGRHSHLDVLHAEQLPDSVQTIYHDFSRHNVLLHLDSKGLMVPLILHEILALLE